MSVQHKKTSVSCIISYISFSDTATIKKKTLSQVWRRLQGHCKLLSRCSQVLLSSQQLYSYCFAIGNSTFIYVLLFPSVLGAWQQGVKGAAKVKYNIAVLYWKVQKCCCWLLWRCSATLQSLWHAVTLPFGINTFVHRAGSNSGNILTECTSTKKTTLLLLESWAVNVVRC